ncbi:MAG TPA: HEAT repeat domain-containing protein [Bryobacteraceae bacterium]|nr:HEAT repeat domain-containing protein [Bryobacteraceae bacterium]
MLRFFFACCALAAAGVCQTSPIEECRQTLETALHDRNPDIRKLAVVALSLAGSRAPYLSMLEGALGDNDVEVRLAAVASLSDLNGKASTQALHKALADPVPEVSFAAAKALWARQDPAGRQALLSVLSGDAKTSSNYFTKEKRDALRMVHTPKTMFLFAVKQGVGFAPVPGLGEGIASMQALLSDPGMSGRATAALLLGKDKSPATTEALRDALSNKEWGVRAAAVHALALRDDPSLTSAVLPLVHDKSEPVRLRAAAAYLRLELIKASPRAKKSAHTPRT